MATKIRSEEVFAIIPEWLLYSEVSHVSIRIYGVLRRHADKETDLAFPGHAKIAKLSHCSKASVKRALGELETAGAIRIRQRYNPATERYSTNEYLIRTRKPKGGVVSDLHGQEDAAETSNDLPSEEEKHGGGVTSDPVGGEQVPDDPTSDPERPQGGVTSEPKTIATRRESPNEVARKRAPDEAFEALLESCYRQPYVEIELTEKARGAANRALAEIRGAYRGTRDGLAAEIRLRAGRWHRAHPPDWTISPSQLAKEWPDLKIEPVPKTTGNKLDQQYAQVMGGES